MKYGWLLCFSLACMAILVGGCDMAPMDFDLSKADNPEYEGWKGFPVGSGFEFAGMQQEGATNPQEFQINRELLVFDRMQASVRQSKQTFNAGRPGPVNTQDLTLWARIKKTACPFTQPDVQEFFRGWDSLLIGETRYDCEVRYYIVKYDAEIMGVPTRGETGMKIWQCKKIPGGIAKIEIASLSPDRLFLLSGQVVRVNIGPGYGRPASTYKPTPAANSVTATDKKTVTPMTSQPAPHTYTNPAPVPTSRPEEMQPTSLPTMPQPDKKLNTAGLKTAASDAEEQVQPKPASDLPAIRKPDPELLSEMNESFKQGPVDATVSPKSLGGELESVSESPED